MDGWMDGWMGWMDGWMEELIPPFFLCVCLYSLYSKGRVLGYERAMRNQNPNTSLIQVEGVQTTKDAQFYLGKRIAYVYRAKREVNGSKIRVIWGRIARTHGTNGVVKARFRNNLPPKSFGASVRIVSSPYQSRLTCH
jgi:large subunit ribosomal protein L35Ae